MSVSQTTHISSLKDICRCCHSSGKFKSLKEQYNCRGKVEVYYRMVVETFGILINPPILEASYTICDECIVRLRDSTKFKNQVKSCEEKLNQYSHLFFKPVVHNGDDNTKIEYKEHNFFVNEDETVNIDYNFINVDSELKRGNVSLVCVEDKLNNDNEVLDGHHKNNKHSAVKYELENVNGSEDIGDEVKNFDDDFKDAENAVDHSKKRLTWHKDENKKYKCNDCGRYFVCITRFKIHSRTIHNKQISVDEDLNTSKGVKYRENKDQSFKTNHHTLIKSLLSTSLNTKSTLTQGKNGVQNSKHSNCIECRFCKKQVREYYYQRHLKIHVGETECINCGDIFDSTDLLKEHTRKHKYENMCTCDFCKKRFIVKSTLKRHIDLHHMDKGRKFMCHECGVFFNDITNLRAHTTTVHLKLRMFQCTICQKKFASKKTLTVHIRTHTGERPYVCDKCGDGFICYTKLKIHKIKHGVMRKDGSKHVCKICHRTFIEKGLLTHHIRCEHPGLLPISSKRKYLPCPSCKKVFSQKFSLERHMTKHGVIDKVPCKICNKMLTNKFSLYRHVRNVHSSKEKAIREKVQCSLCKRKVKDIENHMTVHTVRPMKCETCGKYYPDAAILHRHVMNVHHDANKIFQCKKCDRRPYSRRENLRSHMLKKHGCDLKAD